MESSIPTRKNAKSVEQDRTSLTMQHK